MKWLLTVPAESDLAELGGQLAAHGVSLDLASCIPLEDGEQVVEAEGPRELPALLERAGLGSVQASPSSELELYEETGPDQ